jgi:hypothetical protein
MKIEFEKPEKAWDIDSLIELFESHGRIDDANDLKKHKSLMLSGYAGVNKQGTIVDRREHKDAMPIPAHTSPSGIVVPEPKEVLCATV